MKFFTSAFVFGLALCVQAGAYAGDVRDVSDAGKTISPTRARALFFLHCAGCHQVDGTGQPQVGVPSMHNTLSYFLGSPEGRAFLVQVPGARNASVSDAELAAMTNWQLQTFSKESLPADFVPYTEKEVTAARHHAPVDITTTRARILDGLRDAGKLPAEVQETLKVRGPNPHDLNTNK